jgi:signal transduction histidine kinase
LSRETTILTVDDNDALRYTLTRTLRREGYKVLEARNGAEALQLAGQSPDLITLDLNLPDLDGFEVCRRLRSNPLTAHIPILHISATFVEPQHRVRGLEGGADAFLAEPISGDELLATIGALLRMKQAEKEARLQASEAEKAKEELRKAHDDLDRRVHERTSELAEKNEEIRVLTGRLLKLQDDERRRLARELHDSTGQVLAAMKMNLDFINAEAKGKNEKIEGWVLESDNMIEEMSRQLRTMSYLLHPPLLDEIGLQSALRWYVDGFTQRSGIQAQLEIESSFPRLAEGAEIAIFRVVQESLTNIHRHSENKLATIRLSRSPESIQLQIADTGTGSQAQAAKFVPGVGVMGMQERIRQLGGDFRIESAEKGVTVTVTIPSQPDIFKAGPAV